MNSDIFNDVGGPFPKKRKLNPQSPYTWIQELNQDECIAADVSWFKHVPVSKIWTEIQVGQMVEVENPDKSCWEAQIIEIKGYKALLRYEGLEEDPATDFWVHLCTEDIHHLGWCESMGKSLIPPNSIAGELVGYSKIRSSNSGSIPSNIQEQIIKDLTSKYSLNFQVEVVDMNNTGQLRLATIKTISQGRRLYVEYNKDKDDNKLDGSFIPGFWCHQDSPLIHLEGWAQAVGHPIYAPTSYRPEPISLGSSNIGGKTKLVKEGMKLETIDPGNFLDFRCATVKKVLKLDYLMIQVDPSEGSDKEADWFCVHADSPYIFPCEFSSEHGLSLSPPLPYKNDGSFQWKTYLRKTKSSPMILSKWMVCQF